MNLFKARLANSDEDLSVLKDSNTILVFFTCSVIFEGVSKNSLTTL